MVNRRAVNRISVSEVRKAAEYVISLLPQTLRQKRLPQLPRVCEEISWVFIEGGTVVDLGGGAGFHTSICARLGMKAFCVDNFKVRGTGHSSDHFGQHDLGLESIATGEGVEFIHTDLIGWEPPFGPASIDVVMTFDNIEHLHHSPRTLYKRIIHRLKLGGLFVLGAPNAANLFKRVRVPLAKTFFQSLKNGICMNCLLVM